MPFAKANHCKENPATLVKGIHDCDRTTALPACAQKARKGGSGAEVSSSGVRV